MDNQFDRIKNAIEITKEQFDDLKNPEFIGNIITGSKEEVWYIWEVGEVLYKIKCKL